MNTLIDDKLINEFSELLVTLPMFNTLNNTNDIKQLFSTVLSDLYQTIPEDIINFLKNQPSKKFLTLYFMQFGIDDNITKTIPDDYKAKIIYILNQLFEKRGTPQIYKLFAQVMEDVLGDINFYNVVVEETDEYVNAKYQVPVIDKIEYLEDDGKYYPIEKYYAKDISNIGVAVHYPTLTPHLTISFDYANMKKVTTVTLKVKPWYKIKFTLAPTAEQIALDPANSEPFEIFIDSSDLTGSIKTDLSISDSQTHGIKKYAYKLKPVYIMDPKKLITDLDANIVTSKYFMRLEQYISRNDRVTKRNIFPVHTNVLYIQYNTGDDIYDTMSMYPDLVRMYGTTALQNNKFYINIGNYSNRIPLGDYLNILTYIKIEELKFRNPGWDFDTTVYRFNSKLDRNEVIPNYYSYFQYPLTMLPTIETLIQDYKNLLIDNSDTWVLENGKYIKKLAPYDQLKEFKFKFNSLLSTQENIDLNTVFTSADLRAKLYGNLPETLTPLIELLTGFLNEQKANGILDAAVATAAIDELTFIKNEWNLTELDRDTFINLLLTYSESNYILFRQKIISKYPRLIQEIERLKDIAKVIDPLNPNDPPLGDKIYFETFLNLYRQVDPDVSKTDKISKIFIRDMFSRFILSDTFKKEFFNPIINLFENYFFNIDQSYMNDDTQILKIKDKMNFIPLKVINQSAVGTKQLSRNIVLNREPSGVDAKKGSNRTTIVKQIKDQNSGSFINDDVTLSVYRNGVIIDL